MTGRPTSARRWLRRAAGCIAAGLVAGAASAQTAIDPTGIEGFAAGPFVLAPSLATSVAYDSNVFFTSANSDPSGDQVLVVQPSVLLTLPFSNSVFRLGDTLRYTDYQETDQTAGKTANDALAQLVLNFGTSDTLELAAHSIEGVADTLFFDPGGASTFQGHAYDLHTEIVSLKRDESVARGYRLALQRSALHFAPDQDVEFFNFRGFDAEAAYLEPLSSNTRLSIGYLGSRYDHYSTDDPYVINRKEAGDSIYAQLDGRLGPRQPFSIRLGWERLAFTLNDFKDFSGIVGFANFGTIVGGGVTLTLRAERAPYRSFFDQTNYYVFELVGAKLSRRFPQGSEFGGNFEFFSNKYDDPFFIYETVELEDWPEVDVVQLVDSGYRRDRARRLEAYASVALRDHLAVRFAIAKNWRFSNYRGGDYDALAVSGGIVFGWN